MTIKIIHILKIKLLSILIFMVLCGHLNAQEKLQPSGYELELIEKASAHKSQVFFYKAAHFFAEKNWDSTLVYSMRHLNSEKSSKELKAFSHLLRGESFVNKKIFKQAEAEFRLIPQDFEYYNLVKFNLAGTVLEQNQFQNAIDIYLELSNLSDKEYVFFKKSSVNSNLSLCYLHLGEFDKAKPYLVENIELSLRKKDTLGLIKYYGNMANFYYEQYKDNLAIPYFEKAYQLSKNIKDIESKQLTANNMAVVEENRKHFKEALAYRKESEQWKDSLNNQNKIYEVANLERQFAVKQKQKEVDLLEAENKAKEIEKNGLLYSAIVLLLLLVTAIYFYREKLKTNKIITAQKERLDALNATKDKLFSIVSHDLRSSVNALKMSNTKLLDNLEAKNLDALDDLLQTNSAIVNGAYNLLDNLLHWALLQTNQSYFEITSLRLFFIVEQTVYNYKPLMLEKQITFENTISKQDVVFADQESLKIILRNLLDNAIKFSNTNGSIKIYTQNADDAFLDLIVEDSGVGMSPSKRLELLSDTTVLSKKENENIIGTGLGLQLCKSMIKKNNGTFAIESTLGSGTKMIISLPKKV
ncbi:tetratricopeptide repeat-containing sensor histidine kinase [Siansivirga zeaxanthinifaciens]|uniref:histidine kinase n=1 Tax=Siansivirga zeaxanthinifaciens CC-SAMT-1 TaxID=1454006 RepID=A0A0C5VW58_9FLAO|nr:tetratricopeptide repeat-containing sensor histidine kinase [Siansivirga zeaxanthinifaciens]AJR03336.1 histidine kinase [Siansivirga zeaxanthinifaciens CC-SAMT-1]